MNSFLDYLNSYGEDLIIPAVIAIVAIAVGAWNFMLHRENMKVSARAFGFIFVSVSIAAAFLFASTIYDWYRMKTWVPVPAQLTAAHLSGHISHSGSLPRQTGPTVSPRT